MVAMEFASLKLSEPNPGGIPASTPREKDRGPQKTRQLPKPTRKWIKKSQMYQPTVGEDLKVLQLDRSIKSHPADNGKRRSLYLSRESRDVSWGFTLQSYGIKRPSRKLLELVTYVDYVELAGPAFVAGLRRGDVILSLNGMNVEGIEHSNLVTYIKNSGTTLRMVVLFEDVCRQVELHQRRLQLQKLLQTKVHELASLDRLISGLETGNVSPSQPRLSDSCSTLSADPEDIHLFGNGLYDSSPYSNHCCEFSVGESVQPDTPDWDGSLCGSPTFPTCGMRYDSSLSLTDTAFWVLSGSNVTLNQSLDDRYTLLPQQTLQTPVGIGSSRFLSSRHCSTPALSKHSSRLAGSLRDVSCTSPVGSMTSDSVFSSSDIPETYHSLPVRGRKHRQQTMYVHPSVRDEFGYPPSPPPVQPTLELSLDITSPDSAAPSISSEGTGVSSGYGGSSPDTSPTESGLGFVRNSRARTSSRSLSFRSSFRHQIRPAEWAEYRESSDTVWTEETGRVSSDPQLLHLRQGDLDIRYQPIEKQDSRFNGRSTKLFNLNSRSMRRSLSETPVQEEPDPIMSATAVRAIPRSYSDSGPPPYPPPAPPSQPPPLPLSDPPPLPPSSDTDPESLSIWMHSKAKENLSPTWPASRMMFGITGQDIVELESLNHDSSHLQVPFTPSNQFCDSARSSGQSTHHSQPTAGQAKPPRRPVLKERLNVTNNNSRLKSHGIKIYSRTKKVLGISPVYINEQNEVTHL